MTRLAPSITTLLHPLAELNGTPRLPGYSYKLAEGYGLDVAFTDSLDIDEKKMAVWIAYADGNRRDGVGDLLVVEGIDESRHRKNPIHLFDHGKSVTLPVGKVEDPETGRYTGIIDPVTRVAKDLVYYYQGTGLPGVDKSSEYDHALFCQQVFHLLAQKFIRGGSIGYQVLQARELPPEPMKGTPKGLHLLAVLKLESSTVVMPANADTVRKGLAPDLREVLAMPRICGKPLSPMLVKSLAPYAPENTKTVSGYEGTKAEASPDAATVNNRQPYAQAQAAASQTPKMGVRQKPDGFYVYDPTTGQDQFGPFFSQGIALRWAERLNMGKKNVKELRKKYRRTAKGLVRRLRKSSPGSGIVYVSSKDMEEARKQAESKGVKFEHLTSKNGTAKVRLTGDDGLIDEVAKGYGRLVKFQGKKSMGEEVKLKIRSVTIGGVTWYTAELYKNGGRSLYWTGAKKDSKEEAKREAEEYAREWGERIVKSIKAQPLREPQRTNVHAGTEESGETVIARRAIMQTQNVYEYFAQPGDRLTVVGRNDVGQMRVRNRAGLEQSVTSIDVRRKAIGTKASDMAARERLNKEAEEASAIARREKTPESHAAAAKLHQQIMDDIRSSGSGYGYADYEYYRGRASYHAARSKNLIKMKALKSTKANPLTLIVVGDEVEVIPGSGGHTQYHGGDRGIVKEVRPTGYVIQIPGEPRPTAFEKDEVKLVRKKSMGTKAQSQTIGQVPGTNNFFVLENGTVWLVTDSGQRVNQGSEQDFRAKVQNNQVRFKPTGSWKSFKDTKSMKHTKKKDGDDIPVGDESTTASGEERQLPLGAQVLRRIHEDISLLMADYDEMLGPLENEAVKARLQTKLENFVEELTEIEEEHGKLYPDLEGLVGTKEGELEEAADLDSDGEPDNSKEEFEEELEATPKDMDTMDDDAVGGSSEERDEVSPEDALEGMHADEEEGEKSLRNGRKVKSLRKKYGKKAMCPECGKEDCECGATGQKIAPALVAAVAPAVGQLVGGALTPKDKGYVKEAGGFLGEVGQPDSVWDDESRMKSYHYHKTLSGMVQMSEANEELNEGEVEGDIPPAEFEPGVGAKTHRGGPLSPYIRAPEGAYDPRGPRRPRRADPSPSPSKPKEPPKEPSPEAKAVEERRRSDINADGEVRGERNEVSRQVTNPAPDPKPGQPAEISMKTGPLEVLQGAGDFLKELAFLPELDDDYRGRSSEMSKALNDFVGPDEEEGMEEGDPEGVVMEEEMMEEEPGMEMKFLADEADLQNKKIAELSRMLSRLPI